MSNSPGVVHFTVNTQRIGAVYALTTFSFLFPYIKILPLQSYNQPNALLMSALLLLLVPTIPSVLPRLDRIFLYCLATFGTFLLFLAAPSGLEIREVQFWLSYVSPLVLVPVMLHIITRNVEQFRTMLTAAVLTWIAVGLIQFLIAPNFLIFLIASPDASSLGEAVLASGRGALSLAPEPTHHGFQMLLLAAAVVLVGGRPWVAALAVLDAVLVAMSSSALLALGLGGVLWCLLRLRRLPVLVLGVLAGASGLALAISYFSEKSRIIGLLKDLVELGPKVILLDYSVNARIYGFWEPLKDAFERGLMPLGMGHATWLETRERLLDNNADILGLSLNGVSSGLGMLLVQGGFFMLPVVLYFFARICLPRRALLLGVLPCAAFMVFVSAYYISSPMFSLVLAAAIWAARAGKAGTAPAHAIPDGGWQRRGQKGAMLT